MSAEFRSGRCLAGWIAVLTVVLGACARNAPAGGSAESAPSAPSVTPAAGSMPSISARTSSPASASAPNSDPTRDPEHTTPEPSSDCPTAASLGATALLELEATTSAEQAAIQAVRRELTRVLENPGSYFGTVQTASDLILVELWHKSGLSPEAGCHAPGKRRTMTFDPRAGKIVATKIWE
ncbi:MAG TPA: hypothetical protein VFQ61_25665 [Polyangiaceae bacterium]|nr:hypothetical protein [Polyangiaceae bacterium]